jgi:hypothetical protein
MTSKHTPGPWYADNDWARVRRRSDDAVVARLSDGEDADPNVMLISDAEQQINEGHDHDIDPL